MTSKQSRYIKKKYKRLTAAETEMSAQSSHEIIAASNDKRAQLLQKMNKSKDFVNDMHKTPQLFSISYYKTLIDLQLLHRDVLPYLNKENAKTIQQFVKDVPVEQIIITDNPNKIEDEMMRGSVMVQLHEDGDAVALIPVRKENVRDVVAPEVEFTVVGPKESFIESLETNMQLVRKRLPTTDLRAEMLEAGHLTKTKTAVLYIDGITNQENVNAVIQRIKDIDIDQIVDSSIIAQLISDDRNSPFPQIIDTERPDRVASALAEGKVAVLVDGAPHALIAPTTVVEYFSAFEDYFLNWILASFIRLIRLFAVLFSILITPIYVAVLTYHYELLPKDLLSTLLNSRRDIPFPPILEAVFLELMIELLREAGARLPSKVGQTIGIVGGIVIGTASVEAGLTSNVLLIFVALAALASFTTPVYQMGNTIRFLRFPFLCFAQLWGLLGIVICFCFLLIHLLRLTSLGRPVLEPVYPFRLTDFKDAFFRLPPWVQLKRPKQLQTRNPRRFHRMQTKSIQEIDE